MISADRKYIGGVKYFNYQKIEMYKLKSFEYFLEAIENHKIKISLILRLRKIKTNQGKPDYKNLTFAINKQDLDYIFYKI